MKRFEGGVLTKNFKIKLKASFLVFLCLVVSCTTCISNVYAQTKKEPTNVIKVTTPSAIDSNTKNKQNTTTGGGIIVDPGKKDGKDKKPTPKPKPKPKDNNTKPKLDDSILVLNAGQNIPVAIYSKASLKSKKVGQIYGSLAEVKLIKKEGSFSLIQGIDYDKASLINGYVSTSKIKRVKVNKAYRVTVDISDQAVYIYKGEKLYKKTFCSTGKNATPTPTGRYLIGIRGTFFYKNDVRADNWVRFNYNYMFHSILYDKKTGNLLTNTARRIGNKASHGCIRLPAKDAKWFYDTIPSGTLLTIQK